MNDPRIDIVLALAEKLIAIFEADIAALQACQPRQMASLTAPNQELIAAYGREAQQLTRAVLQAAPETSRQRLEELTARIRQTLSQHRRMVLRVKNASEGLIKAVAEEVDKRRARSRPYSAAGTAAPANTPAQARPAGSALLYNALV